MVVIGMVMVMVMVILVIVVANKLKNPVGGHNFISTVPNKTGYCQHDDVMSIPSRG